MTKVENLGSGEYNMQNSGYLEVRVIEEWHKGRWKLQEMVQFGGLGGEFNVILHIIILYTLQISFMY